MDTLRDVGRQEKQLLERLKLSKAITTRQMTRVKRKRNDKNKGFYTKIDKKGADG